jgi:hypothetical protein
MRLRGRCIVSVGARSRAPLVIGFLYVGSVHNDGVPGVVGSTVPGA